MKHEGDSGTSVRSRYAVKPFQLKKVLGLIRPKFSGYDQEDAQEFLKALLECIHDDVNRVQKKPKYKELKDHPEMSNQELSNLWFDYNLKRDNSIIVDCFGG